MKKIFLILLISILPIMACGDDDDKPSPPKKDIDCYVDGELNIKCH